MILCICSYLLFCRGSSVQDDATLFLSPNCINATKTPGDGDSSGEEGDRPPAAPSRGRLRPARSSLLDPVSANPPVLPSAGRSEAPTLVHPAQETDEAGVSPGQRRRFLRSPPPVSATHSSRPSPGARVQAVDPATVRLRVQAAAPVHEHRVVRGQQDVGGGEGHAPCGPRAGRWACRRTAGGSCSPGWSGRVGGRARAGLSDRSGWSPSGARGPGVAPPRCQRGRRCPAAST
jgi:hypothetical protein